MKSINERLAVVETDVKYIRENMESFDRRYASKFTEKLSWINLGVFTTLLVLALWATFSG